jgi:hypothetical protein
LAIRDPNLTVQRRIVSYETFPQQLLDLAQAQVAPGVEPDHMSDDLKLKPAALVADLL